MASTVTNDPNVVDANPVKYSRALQNAAGGHVLWHPSHIERDGGIIGDCGYFDGGRFQVLFNVFDPPTELGIPALPRPTGRELRVEELPNYNTILQSSHSHTIRVEASLESPPLPNLPYGEQLDRPDGISDPGDWDARGDDDQDAELNYTLLAAQPDLLSEALDRELVRSTPPKPHNDPLPRALSVISALANDMDEGKRDAERGKNPVLWQSRIRGKFPSPLVQPHRRFIMDGHLMLTRVVRKSTTSSEVVHSGGEKTVIQVDCLKTDSSSRYLVAILCNDLLVLCKNPSDGKDPATLVDLWAVLRMQTLPQPASVVDGNVLRIVDNKAILYLQTASTSEALSWSRAINLHVPALKA